MDQTRINILIQRVREAAEIEMDARAAGRTSPVWAAGAHPSVILELLQALEEKREIALTLPRYNTSYVEQVAQEIEYHVRKELKEVSERASIGITITIEGERL